MSKVTAEELSRAIATAPLEACLRKDGITRKFLVQKLKAELNATEVKAFNDKGVIVYSKPLVDWDIRQRARMDAQKLMGLYPIEKYEIDFNKSAKEMTNDELESTVRAILGRVCTKAKTNKKNKA